MKTLIFSNKQIFERIALAFIVCMIMAVPGCHGSPATADNSKNIPACTISPKELQMVKIPDYLDSQIKEYEGFTVSFNEYHHTPNYVAWELLASETVGPHSRKSNKFRWDGAVNGCPEHEDYTHSGFDRGHMIPAADCKYSAKAMEDCFYLTNICPQNHSLNSGGWKKLEEACRQWALRFKAIVIIAGPIYKNTDTRFIGETGVRVPSGFFKVILDTSSPEPKAIGFIYPNASSPGQISSYAVTIREVEKLTRFDFFYQLPDTLEEILETQYDYRLWK